MPHGDYVGCEAAAVVNYTRNIRVAREVASKAGFVVVEPLERPEKLRILVNREIADLWLAQRDSSTQQVIESFFARGFTQEDNGDRLVLQGPVPPGIAPAHLFLAVTHGVDPKEWGYDRHHSYCRGVQADFHYY